MTIIQLTRSATKLIEKNTHTRKEREKGDSAPPKRSHSQVDALRSTLSPAPHDSRGVHAQSFANTLYIDMLTARGVSEQPPRGAHQLAQYVWPHGTSALKRLWGFSNELKRTLSAWKKKLIPVTHRPRGACLLHQHDTCKGVLHTSMIDS